MAIEISNPHCGKGKQIVGWTMAFIGLLLIFVVPPVGIVIALLGGAINAVGRFQHWYHWK